MIISDKKENFDRREESREICSSSVFYEYKKLLFKAELKNYSPSGLFIKANDFFLAGEKIDVAIPRSKYKKTYYILM